MNTVTDPGTVCGRVFATESWQDAWLAGQAEPAAAHVRLRAGGLPVTLQLVAHSPLWRGYEGDAGLPPVWDGPVAYLSTVYAVSSPLNQVPAPEAARVAAETVAEALETAQGWGAEALVVTNLEPGPALGELPPPDALVRLDATCRLRLTDGMDAYLERLATAHRGRLRRYHRRGAQAGLTYHDRDVTEAGQVLPAFARLTRQPAERHGTPPLYSEPALRALLEVPGTRLLSADLDGRPAAGLLSFEHDGCLILWAAGIDYTLLKTHFPYYFLIYEAIGAAAARGCRWVDFGRGNLEFKQRLGFHPVDLWSPVYALAPGRRAHYADRLAEMHRRIGDFLGRPG
ncbi:GNAT family N-acetyltransferase [Nonomuraea sp. PA05]|uniref:GNAT family N-acetyltransferase n=1 Tax=Nonomuraea sp. PA05 TaxID=2604466 RepID=UPI0011DB5CEE|nr:GNAT family N-acetyltransferase [Nonomuraea sp. PA05]TYB60269.1 GNAT family N-acetyltransferase [Nonomuraea sp. PA05]